ncbi:MAG TPA: prepilin-type N-terminal cleavage/methylation domain-containing protein [Candidatus Hydrogenedens sp.]|nr:GspJ family type II secretion system protein [Candidatus Hydrogenedens sp.]HOK08692.1 prepilin-type N-terminal cleavage/methylation domain-containing protein [Candidatus Hydrogenedens sp.]HOL18654.1 prepilin-type N-terminal cleavage/methylation domain-containing protein [Candidatus Hydrogenedens sp.]HPP57500.1 prepilin-type N-terminal cleavage/methylation domain-containing protein [Candidatus Hydrogenedens sp.]
MRLNRFRGFSLIEIITVLAVLAVLSTIGIVIFTRIMEYRRVSEIKQKLNLHFLQLSHRLQEDFDQIASSTFTGGAMFGVRRIEEQKRYQSVPLDDDLISFPIIFAKSEGNDSVVRVFYYIDRTLGGVPSLVRVVGSLNEKHPNGAREILISGVLGMRVHYYDGENWVDSWEKEVYPKAVKMSFIFADENRLWEQMVRECTFWLGNML